MTEARHPGPFRLHAGQRDHRPDRSTHAIGGIDRCQPAGCKATDREPVRIDPELRGRCPHELDRAGHVFGFREDRVPPLLARSLVEQWQLHPVAHDVDTSGHHRVLEHRLRVQCRRVEMGRQCRILRHRSVRDRAAMEGSAERHDDRRTSDQRLAIDERPADVRRPFVDDLVIRCCSLINEWPAATIY